MNDQDVVLNQLAKLPPLAPPSGLHARIRAQSAPVLAPAPLHPVWSIAAAASVVVYLGWALLFTRPF